jgi:TPR repeat protein
LTVGGKSIDKPSGLERGAGYVMAHAQKVARGHAESLREGKHRGQGRVAASVLDRPDVVRREARALRDLLQRQPESLPPSPELCSERHLAQGRGLEVDRPHPLVLIEQSYCVDIDARGPKLLAANREDEMDAARGVVRVITHLANPVAVAFSLTACFVPGVQTSSEAPTTVDAPAQADPVDPASLTCEVFTDRSGGCDVNRDCETQCDSGDARACEVMGRHLLTDQGAAAEWANRCRGGARSGWCATPAPEDAAQRFLVRACDLGSGVGCFGLSSLYIAHPEKQRARGELGDVTSRSKAILAKACECGAKDGCSALAKMYVVGAQMMLNERPPNEFKAAVMLVEACKLGDLDACHDGLRIVTTGSRQFDPRLVSDLSANACKHGDQDACAVGVCGRAARLNLERLGKVVSPEALAQPMVACTVAMKNADPKTANEVAACFDSRQSLDCLEPLGGAQFLRAGGDVQRLRNYERECTHGDDFACVRAGEVYEYVDNLANPQLAWTRFKSACDKGNALGCLHAANHLDGKHSAPADLTQRIALLTRSCDLGEPSGPTPNNQWTGIRACSDLAEAYREGGGVARDSTKAFALFSKACEVGHSFSCGKIADMLAKGEGVRRDRARARALRIKLCDSNDTEACAKLCEEGDMRACRTACVGPREVELHDAPSCLKACTAGDQAMCRIGCAAHDDASCLRSCSNGDGAACKEACSADSQPCNALCKTGSEPACEGADEDVVSRATSRNAERTLPTLFAQCRANRAAMERWRVAYVAAQRSGNASEMQHAGAEIEKLGPRWSTTLSDLRQAIQVVTEDQGPRFEELIRRVDRECNCKSSPSGRCR